MMESLRGRTSLRRRGTLIVRFTILLPRARKEYFYIWYIFRAHLDSSVGTVSLQVTGETSLAAAEEFLGRLLWETETHYPGTTVLRWENQKTRNWPKLLCSCTKVSSVQWFNVISDDALHILGVASDLHQNVFSQVQGALGCGGWGCPGNTEALIKVT